MSGLNQQKNESAARRIVGMARRYRSSLGRVLDVGCGTGQVLVASRPFARSLAGTDVDEAFAAAARRAVPEASIQLADVDRPMPFDDGAFDTVFFCDVIEHLHNPYEAVANLRRILAPHGKLVVTTPNANAIARSLLGEKWFALADASHVMFFTRFTLAHLLKKAGFSRVTTSTIGGTGRPVVDAVLESLRNGGTIVAVASKGDAG